MKVVFDSRTMPGQLMFLVSLICVCHGGFITENIDSRLPCIKPHCAPAPHGCRTYVSKDKVGCPTGCDYACGAPWCGLRPCSRLCFHGYVQDALGCNTCHCTDECQRKPCETDCQYGYVQDSNGCPTCECKLEFPSCLAWVTCDQGLCPDSCKCQPNCFDAYPLPDNPVVFSL